MAHVIFLAATIVQLLNAAYAAKILMSPTQFQSHVMTHLAVGEELVRRGHDVYVALGSRYPKLDDVKELGLQPVLFHFPPDDMLWISKEGDMLIADLTFNHTADDDATKNALRTAEFVIRDCEYMMSDNAFLDQVRKLDVDVIVVDAFALNPCNLLLPHRLGIRFITLTPIYLPWNIRSPALPSFALLTGLQKSNLYPSTFSERLSNALGYLRTRIVQGMFWNTTLLNRFAAEISSWDELFQKSELFITNFDHHTSTAWPLMPNIVSCPGVTVRPARALPDSLEKIFTDASEGVILATLGSMAFYMPTEIVAKFLEAFSDLKLTVIARFAVPEGVTVPTNVHLLSWLPQNDILGHPKTRLFITHCGSNGLHEALYHGVPMLGFPLFAEQPANCHRAYLKGFGLEMDILNFTSAELHENIEELMNNSTYRTTIRRMSDAWRGEPMIGREKAAFWIEHVIKYGGEHLRPSAMDLLPYQFYMLDILALGLASVVGIVILLMVVLWWTITECRKYFQRATRSNEKKVQ